ncbi:uncharacterized protein isoform X2 [Rhodnius prolixus]|uniref:uncharacterized protein isoform X2 n=1 Tax=Rhodnius prolixus TaxID=13249 RepID=UPI003D18B0BB
MAFKLFYALLSVAALLTISLAAPSPKEKEALEPKEDLKTDATYGFGYAYPFYGYGGYYPYYGYGYGLGYGYGYGGGFIRSFY